MKDIEEPIITIFLNVKRTLSSYYLFREKKTFKDILLKICYKAFGRYIKNNNINYDCLALQFNKIYFWKNFIKCLLFFNKYNDIINDSILDVGCGAAPASIAFSSLMSNKERINVSISLIDKSKKQLMTAQSFLNYMSIQTRTFIESSFKIRYENYDELVVFSYFFCEQDKNFLNELFENRKKFYCGFVVIDYLENIEKIYKYFKDNGDNNIEFSILHYAVPPIISKTICEKEVNVYGCYYKPQSKS